MTRVTTSNLFGLIWGIYGHAETAFSIIFFRAIGQFDFLEIDDFVLMETTGILDFDFSWRVGVMDSLSCNSSADIS